MLLCDIGNTSFHFLDDSSEYKKDVITFNPKDIKEVVYYICVNQAVQESLNHLDNWIDISIYIDKSKYYETMGIDRIFACEALNNSIIIDAGSAITVDLVKNGIFEGGFIYPGVIAMQKTYKNISPALDYSFNFELDLDKMPKNSRDAISYAYLKTFYSEVVSHDMEIVLTGGDAKKFALLFKDAKVNERLIFDGMKKIIKKVDLC